MVHIRAYASRFVCKVLKFVNSVSLHNVKIKRLLHFHMLAIQVSIHCYELRWYSTKLLDVASKERQHTKK